MSGYDKLKVESERLDIHVQKSCNWLFCIMFIFNFFFLTQQKLEQSSKLATFKVESEHLSILYIWVFTYYISTVLSCFHPEIGAEFKAGNQELRQTKSGKRASGHTRAKVVQLVDLDYACGCHSDVYQYGAVYAAISKELIVDVCYGFGLWCKLYESVLLMRLCHKS